MLWGGCANRRSHFVPFSSCLLPCRVTAGTIYLLAIRAAFSFHPLFDPVLALRKCFQTVFHFHGCVWRGRNILYLQQKTNKHPIRLIYGGFSQLVLINDWWLRPGFIFVISSALFQHVGHYRCHWLSWYSRSDRTRLYSSHRRQHAQGAIELVWVSRREARSHPERDSTGTALLFQLLPESCF